MIAGMAPHLRDGDWVFVTLPGPIPPGLTDAALASFREDEGMSLVLPLEVARAAGLPDADPMACITLGVHSALDGVGLTAAVSGALAAAGIPCNMVAAYHHDHLFVPRPQASAALATLARTAANATVAATAAPGAAAGLAGAGQDANKSPEPRPES